MELAGRIRDEVSSGMEKTQRDFLLRQQMAAIRKELGEGDDVRVSQQLSDLARAVSHDIEVWNEQEEQS